MCHRRELMPPDSVKYGYFAHKSPLLRFPVWGSMFPYRVYKTRLERTQIVLDIFRAIYLREKIFRPTFAAPGKVPGYSKFDQIARLARVVCLPKTRHKPSTKCVRRGLDFCPDPSWETANYTQKWDANNFFRLFICESVPKNSTFAKFSVTGTGVTVTETWQLV